MVKSLVALWLVGFLDKKASRAWIKQTLLQGFQTFYYVLGVCYTASMIKNSDFLFNSPLELPIQFLEKAIIEIDLIQQKSIVPFKYY